MFENGCYLRRQKRFKINDGKPKNKKIKVSTCYCPAIPNDSVLICKTGIMKISGCIVLEFIEWAWSKSESNQGRAR